MNNLASKQPTLLTDSYHAESNTVCRPVLTPAMTESDSNWDNPLTRLFRAALTLHVSLISSNSRIGSTGWMGQNAANTHTLNSTQSCSPWPCSSVRMHLPDQHSGPADKKWWMQIVLLLTLSSVYGDLVAAGVLPRAAGVREWWWPLPQQPLPPMKTKYQSSIKRLRNCFFISVCNCMTKGAISFLLLIY